MENSFNPHSNPAPEFQQQKFQCPQCYASVEHGSRFCTNCGMKLMEKEEVLRHSAIGEKPMLWPLAQYGVLLAYCLIVKFAGFGISPMSAMMVNVVMAVIIIAFAMFELQSLKEVFIWKKFNVIVLLSVIGGAMVTAFAVNIIASALENLSGEYYELYMYQDSPMPDRNDLVWNYPSLHVQRNNSPALFFLK